MSTGVSHFRWFSLGYAVNFAVSIFLLSVQLWLVGASNGKPLHNFRYGTHSTIAITMDTYSHVLPSMHQDVARKLDDMFGDV